jgi:hypothetical protein
VTLGITAFVTVNDHNRLIRVSLRLELFRKRFIVILIYIQNKT